MKVHYIKKYKGFDMSYQPCWYYDFHGACGRPAVINGSCWRTKVTCESCKNTKIFRGIK